MPPRRRRPPRAGALTELPPLKILRSILLLQTAYYAAALILILFSTLVLGQSFSFNLLFDWTSVRGDNTLGWTIGIIWLLVGFVTVIPIILLIAKSKLVPDFALTIHFFHFIVTWLYTKALPTNLLWWGLQATSAFLMISMGVWACRWREMQPISFGTVPVAKNNANGSAVGDEEAGGHIRGQSGSGRRVDNGPSYEMTERAEASG